MKSDIKKIAQMLLDQELSVIEASIKLVPLLSEIDRDNDDDFIVFKAIYSDSDGLPIDEEQRKLWNKEALKSKDKEIEEINKFYKEASIKAAEKLIKVL